jgi:hypothetical protein
VILNADISNISNQEMSVKDLTYKVADSILNTIEEFLELENKIALSIAIRLKAEEFMLAKINIEDPIFVAKNNNQTIDLIKKYKTLSGKEKNAATLIDRINLMTPENIHLNSFMYEPILDMSSRKLKDIYREMSSIHQDLLVYRRGAPQPI